MDLNELESMWEKDCVLDPDNLHEESLNECRLHAKYYRIYTTFKILKTKKIEEYKKIKLERYNYYTGLSDPKESNEDPFPYKLRDKDSIQRYLDADDKLSTMSQKISYYDRILEFLDDIIKQISKRSYIIRNAIEWQKFKNGFGG
jgi:hypothetical protein